jgi:hypothetical protein
MSRRNKKRMRFGIALNVCGALTGIIGGAITGLTVLYAVAVLATLMTVSSLWTFGLLYSLIHSDSVPANGPAPGGSHPTGSPDRPAHPITV